MGASLWEVEVVAVVSKSIARKLKPLAVRFTSMGSPCEIRVMAVDQKLGAYVIEQAVKEVRRLNDKYSRYRPDSVTSQINQSAGSGHFNVLDAETQAIINYADVCYQQSDGLFDITSGVLRKAWNFKVVQNKETVPSQSYIDELLDLVGWEKVLWKGDSFALPKKNMEIDFGGIVKEYCADAVATLCLNYGINTGLIDLGGDIRIIGPYPEHDTWTVHIQDPQKIKKSCAQLDVLQGGIATSGIYERFIEIEGKRYSHLLNPKTGWPVEEYIASLTVLADQCIIAGSIATIGILKGRDGLSWLQENIDLPYWCCLATGELITNDGVK
ncbi:Thiamine biosynthesis lipoprotein ApbE precursor [Legionella quateirensis]|uniref:FAD:protein FMN transferase n=1 Tax=Legionella quateirensis TaxID=45072 RepID=A0A378KQH5_9GAMM|nr:Thiamine biosynthesis lipoprotein ApbE precursor [Legionella quateirensis]STY16843.1 Thiamine biosynthesis lipoprotein ApbE precursor [Legionella quateirensis]